MKLRITVEGQEYEVDVEVLGGEESAAAPAAPVARTAPAPKPAAAPLPPAAATQKAPPAPAGAGAGVFPSPLSGTVRSIKVSPGDAVQANQEIMVLEAMKMETSIYAPSAGTVKAVLVKEGDSVQAGAALVEFA